uniref:receptor protein-tyrosine kinase n=1 Tax=Lutzomyia longipalpis TaxID=7200 RepID=A0A1B0CWR4_LUTLO
MASAEVPQARRRNHAQHALRMSHSCEAMRRHLWLFVVLVASTPALVTTQRPLSNSSSASFASGVVLGPQMHVPTTNTPHAVDPFASNGGQMNSYYPGSYTGRSRNKDKFNELRNLSLMNNVRAVEPVAGRDTRPSLWNYKDRQGDDPVYPPHSKDPVFNLKERFKEKLNTKSHHESEIDDVLGVKCSFETECAWTWNETIVDGFQVVTGANLTESNRTGIMPGPPADALNDAGGHFLHLRLTPETGQRILRSPVFSTTRENCYLQMFIHQSSMSLSSIRLVIEPVGTQESSWVISEIAGNDLRRWELNRFRIDRVSKDFHIVFEVVPNGLGGRSRGHVSIDNLQMVNCFAENPNGVIVASIRSNAIPTSRNKDKFNELRNLSLMNNVRAVEPVAGRDTRPSLWNYKDRQGDDPVYPPHSKDPVFNLKERFKEKSSMSLSSIRLVIEPVGTQESSWVISEIAGNDLRRWELNRFRIDRVSKDFHIVFEVVPNGLGGRSRGHVSIDNLQMVNCFAENPNGGNCSLNQVKCNSNKVSVCIDFQRICDISAECDESEDENLNCDKIPFGGRCDFENGWCGWQNSGKAILVWSHHTGPTPTDKTGPDSDHTHLHMNVTGHYMYVNMNQHVNDGEKKKLVGFASNAVMNSVVFNPPPSVHSNASSPYRNTCMGPRWVRVEATMPNISTKYYLQFEARMGMRIFSDVAIDDFSLSPECFGLNIPMDHLHGYNYWDPRIGLHKQPHMDFVEKTALELNTCGAKGILGPNAADCLGVYNATELLGNVRVIENSPHKGVQVWKVPSEGYYTIVAKGAGGGLGSGGVGSSRGAMAVTVIELHKDEEIFVLVGQSGEHACIKSMGYRDESCEPISDSREDDRYTSKTHKVKNTVIEDGAGGGGGGTFVFLLNAAAVAVPLVVAGGGGGLGIGRYLDDDLQHGTGMDESRREVSGQIHGDIYKAAGPGGGWRAKDDSALDSRFGASLLEGGRGGLPCYPTRGLHGQGGFGGGGGGCMTGGGGGGYSGGDILSDSPNGQGGASYIGMRRTIPELSQIYVGANSGPGAVIIIPAIQGCGCDYRCVALDEFRSLVACICPEGWQLRRDNLTTCELLSPRVVPLQYLIIFFIVISLSLLAALTGLIFMLSPPVGDCAVTSAVTPTEVMPPNGPPVDKLISLDTPQQTPTTTCPPMSLGLHLRTRLVRMASRSPQTLSLHRLPSIQPH